MKYVLALDQGTTSCRAILFDAKGNPVSVKQQELTQYFPHPGWVEHDPMEIWNLQVKVMEAAAAGYAHGDIAAIGVTNQRETTVVWDRLTGMPLHRAIVWQCRRTTDLCEQLKLEGWEDKIRAKTGLLLDPYFSATKLQWLLNEYPDIRRKAEKGEALFGTIDSWLIWKLTGGKVHVTDYSNASRTMLYNIKDLQWDAEILKRLDIPAVMLPDVRASSEIYGTVCLGGNLDGIPIAGAAGDQHAALFGQACYSPGMGKNTYGTGCFMLMNTGTERVVSQKGLLTTIAWGVGGTIEYALEGSVFNAGTVVQWLRDGLGIIHSAEESEALAQSVADTEGVYFVPAFTGMGTPHWNPHARGMITGLTRGSGRGHIARAALESIAYQSAEVLGLMQEESGIPLKQLRVDGGMVRNHFLMQFQADIIGVPTIRPFVKETTALGAAFMAGLAVGVWADRNELQAIWEADCEFLPVMPDGEIAEKLRGWRKAVGYQLEE